MADRGGAGKAVEKAVRTSGKTKDEVRHGISAPAR
jgi:hypothetical protein